MAPQTEENESLLSPLALQMSLSPPRAPPVGTAHRNLLNKRDPSRAALTHHHEIEHDIPKSRKQQAMRATVQCHHGLKDRVGKLLHATHLDGSFRMPHPHLSPDSGDQFTRYLGSALPIWWQHKSRDDGTFRSISDGIVTFSVPSLAVVNHEAAKRFVNLTRTRTTIKYGKYSGQFVDLFLPPDESKRRGLVFFVVSFSLDVTLEAPRIEYLIIYSLLLYTRMSCTTYVQCNS